MIGLLPPPVVSCLTWSDLLAMAQEAEKQTTVDGLPSHEMYLTPANLLWLSLVIGNSTRLKGAAKQSSMQERSDEQLMIDVMAGDQAALAALVMRHHAPLLGYLYRLVGGDQQLAEDLVQETLLRVLRQHIYRCDRPFKLSIALSLIHANMHRLLPHI